MRAMLSAAVAALVSVSLIFGFGTPSAHAVQTATQPATVTADTHIQQGNAPTLGELPDEVAAGTEAEDCWAQAARVVGGFFFALIASAFTPWAAVVYFPAYFTQMSQEQKSPDGNFAC